MAHFARIEHGRVKEIVNSPLSLEDFEKRYHPSLQWVEVEADAREGDAYPNGGEGE